MLTRKTKVKRKKRKPNGFEKHIKQHVSETLEKKKIKPAILYPDIFFDKADGVSVTAYRLITIKEINTARLARCLQEDDHSILQTRIYNEKN